MTKSQIEEIRDKYQQKADKNYKAYQETGTSRYLNEYHKADEIVDICNEALSSADEHDRLMNLSGDVADLAAEAFVDKPENIVKKLRQIAIYYGFARENRRTNK